ncbi:hypothetical protein LLW09_07470 [Pseudomonas paracarnis]|uniref:Uncharacterized protein n=1 Tax=Pseudomonas paracarnis TaxID=2750625 RepID=A0ABU6BQU1_9PSED|nr:hypothetical protein [Pseudomonas paracarnis]MEB3782393.1 hypothetical protein [Pseudomonas paracarnis]
MNRNILNSKIYNKEHQRIFDSEIKKACASNGITESELREFAFDTPLAPVVKFLLYVAFAVVLMVFADGRHEQAFWIWSVAMIFALAWRYHVLKASIRFFMSKDNRQTYKAVKSTLRALQKTLKPINKEQAKAEDAHARRSKRGAVVVSVYEAVEKRIKAEREAMPARSPARSSKPSTKDNGNYLQPGPGSHGAADNQTTSSCGSDSGSSGDGGGGD